MLIDSFAPRFDAGEIHQLIVKAPQEAVYDALWTADLGGSMAIKLLLWLRSLPAIIACRGQSRPRNPEITLQSVIDSGFGLLAEKPNDEIVLGVSGRFWRPSGNLSPFIRSDFDQPIPTGMARAVWNFSLIRQSETRTLLRTETRVLCGDAASRRKFLAYWVVVRPFSGLIRLIMLKRVAKAAECGTLARPSQRAPSGPSVI